MPLPKTTSKDLQIHLQHLGLRHGQNIVVHSRLISFGHIEGGVEAVYVALRNAVGPQGTIAVPTYTLTLGEQTPYDSSSTPSIRMGAFSEFVRRLPATVRSGSPLHNHAAIGPLSSILAEGDGKTSLGVGSDFERLRTAGFSLILLGCGFEEGATFLHHVEALAEVPYRTWITLTRKIIVDGTEQTKEVRYFARAKEEWVEDFAAITGRLEEAGLLRSAPCHFGRSYSIGLGALEDFVRNLLQSDPYSLVRLKEATSNG